MGLDARTCNRQAQPHATVTDAALHKGFEDFVQPGLGQALAVVEHLDAQPAVIFLDQAQVGIPSVVQGVVDHVG